MSNIAVLQKLSDNRTELVQPLIMDGHDLAFVQALLPKLSESLMCIYASQNDPDVFFLCKMGDQTEVSGPIYNFFQVTKSDVEDLLESRIDIFGFELRANGIFFVTQPSLQFVDPGIVFTQPHLGSNDEVMHHVYTREQLESLDSDADFGCVYADHDAGLYKDLLEGTMGLTTFA